MHYEKTLFKHSVERKKQLAISVQPQIEISPKEYVEGDNGEFELSIFNQSPIDIINVRIYEDYFYSVSSQSTETKYYLLGTFNSLPDFNINFIKPKRNKSFTISFKDLLDDINQQYEKNEDGLIIILARLTIKYNRKVDGKEFTTTKVYMIHGDNALLDFDSRGLDLPVIRTINKMKKNLGTATE